MTNHANNEKTKNISIIHIKKEELPIYCPHNNNKLWCMHPRVYLPIVEDETIACPYCSQKFKLITDSPSDDYNT